MGTKGKDQLTRGTTAGAARKVQGDKEQFETYKGEKRTAAAARKGGARREKSAGADFPGGATGFYLTVIGFLAFAAASLYWVVVLSYPKD